MKDFKKRARERFQIISNQEKEKKLQYGREGYKSIREDGKQKLV